MPFGITILLQGFAFQNETANIFSMNRWNLKILMMLSAFTLLACATEEKYRSKVDTWVGMPMEKVLNVWGEPDKVEKVDSGRKVYSYSDHRTREVLGANDPIPASYLLNEAPPETTDKNSKTPTKPLPRRNRTATTDNRPSVDDPCLTVFYVSAEEKVESVGFGGTGCRAR